ncbi:MAG: hypothetical protein ABI662_00305 [Dermatophilaceae bacterium]
MIWAILALLGVPLWLCAIAILTLILRNRAIRNRPGNIPVRVQRSGAKRWTRGNGVWVHDVFAFRGSPAMWSEVLSLVSQVDLRAPGEAEAHKLRHLDDPVVASFTCEDASDSFQVATTGTNRRALLGPYARTFKAR